MKKIFLNHNTQDYGMNYQKGGVKQYDLAIIGSGPGGYVAGLYASRKNLKVCIIESSLVGGTCLNRGCIPTKSLLNSASILTTLKESSIHGVEVKDYKIDFEKVLARKDEIVSRLKAGIETLFRANKIDLLRGHAKIIGPNTIKIDGKDEISAKNIIIASGSKVAELPNIKIDEDAILSSDGVLAIKGLPKSIVIVGGGVIGCEFASLFSAFGAKITIVELMDRLIPTQSREASRKLEVIFKKKGIDILTSSKVESITRAKTIDVTVSGGKKIETEKVFVSVGRKPNIDGLGLEGIGIKTENGRIVVDKHLRTNVKNIYAVGDSVSGPFLAHKASYDGILACDNILGEAREIDYSNIPSCIWTDPEIASVGLSEEEAKAKYPDVRIAKFPYLASGKAFLEGKTEGFIKIIGDSKGNILGVEIFGKGACDLIGEATLAKTLKINIRDWARVVHGHPTLSEIVQEAVHIFCGTPIHSV